MKNVSGMILAILGLNACSSKPVVNGVQYLPDETLSTAGNRSMPDWASEGELKPVIFKDGKVYSVGIATGRSDDRPEALLRISENNSRANIAKSVENRTEFVFQGSEENAGIDSQQAKWIGSEVSSLVTHNMTVEGSWYVRYATSTESGRHILIKAYSLTSLPEADLHQSILSAIRKGEGKQGISKSFETQVNSQWSRFVEGNVNSPSTPQTERKPSSPADEQ